MFLEFKKEVLRVLGKYGDERYLRETEYADLCTTICFKLAKDMNRSPVDLAIEIAQELELGDYVGSVEALNGYINFFVSTEFLEDTIHVISEENENYGNLNIGGEILIEHTSANPDGPLHIGHIRNSIIGDSLARIFRHAGFNVKTHYYVNDMGKQMAVAVLGVEKFGVDENKKPDHAIAEVYMRMSSVLEKNPNLERVVDNLMELYEKGDEEVTKKFRNVVNRVLFGIKQTLKRLKVDHDDFIWESFFIRNNYVSKIFEILNNKNLIKKEDAWILDLEKGGRVVLRRSNGTTLYITRDLAYHLWKNENFRDFIDILGSDHKMYGDQLTELLKLMDLKPPRIVFFEFVSLPEGSMSTREGRFISADELIDKVKSEALRILSSRKMDETEKEKIAEAVAIGAIRFDFVKVAPEKPIVFDWKLALDFERQTANYIQYSHARACSILRNAFKSGERDFQFRGELCTKEERMLVVLLSKFPYYIQKVIKEARPNLIAEYLLTLSSAFNDFYTSHPVLKSSYETKTHRLAIVNSTRIVLRNGLSILGIEPLERM